MCIKLSTFLCPKRSKSKNFELRQLYLRAAIYSDWMLIFCIELEISEFGRIMRSKVLKNQDFYI